MDESKATQLISEKRGAWYPGSFLDELQPTALQALFTAGEPVRFHRTEQLTAEGERTTDVYLLLSSYVKVTGGAGEALLAIRTGGDVIGEIAAVDGGPRTATVTACGREPVESVRISQKCFQQLREEWPEVQAALAAVVNAKLRTATERRKANASRSALIRLARAVLFMAEDFGVPAHKGVVVQVDITQVEWGTMIGCSERTVERAMRELTERDLVEAHRRRTIVCDIGELRGFAYPDHSL